LSFHWTWDGSGVGANAGRYTNTTAWGDAGQHTLRCYVSDDLWLNVVYAQWIVTVLDDNDGDGMPNTWERANGLNPNDPGDRDLDSDHDGMSNYAEWRAGTDPRAQGSHLSLQGITSSRTNSLTGGFLLTWTSVSNKFYTVSRTSALMSGPGFTPITQHIEARSPITTYQDTGIATNAGHFFYRIEVE
jgi:hypothetical protein